MQRFLVVSGLILAATLSGCATTQQVISKVQSPNTPLEQILKERADLVHELATVEFRQYFNNVENPTLAEVKVTQTGLMDDSVAAKRTTYNFKLVDHKWVQVGKKHEHRCARGKNTKDFQTANCP
ncbi:hypothetical protein A3K93_10805 [Acinetobacter sp. NCu2D-2]|uniref:hypothetical protein n=1 Tax=Acinetobacter sp. NCu2D-2 TaxID=1608473 RepID=UPI0007CE03C9|nr:hypothetical protein [Acinetobacter sp. NCu2D-2]ANF82633.1 hypothetical protein A3K93_10805 [Acinetobacter sp. NCu2D-2]